MRTMKTRKSWWSMSAADKAGIGIGVLVGLACAMAMIMCQSCGSEGGGGWAPLEHEHEADEIDIMGMIYADCVKLCDFVSAQFMECNGFDYDPEGCIWWWWDRFADGNVPNNYDCKLVMENCYDRATDCRDWEILYSRESVDTNIRPYLEEHGFWQPNVNQWRVNDCPLDG